MLKNVLILSTAVLILAGCSGKVQTNPLPESKQFYLPKDNGGKTYAVSLEAKENFNQYAKRFFSKRGLDNVLTKSDEELQRDIDEYLSEKNEKALEQARNRTLEEHTSKSIWSKGYEKAKTLH